MPEVKHTPNILVELENVILSLAHVQSTLTQVSDFVGRIELYHYVEKQIEHHRAAISKAKGVS